MNTLMFKIALFAIIISVFSGEFYQKNVITPPDKTYEELWNEVKEFESKGLPKSALEVVEAIYKKAMAEQNSEQVTKSCLYRYKYMYALEEDGLSKVIKQLEADINIMPGKSKYFGYMLLAEIYSDYLEMNYYVIGQRTRLSEFTPDDLATWDVSHFKDKIIKNYVLALNNELKTEPIEKYPELIEFTEKGKKSCPTVFDLFSHMAYRLFSTPVSNWYSNNYDRNEAIITNIQYCETAEVFSETDFLANDSISYAFYTHKVLKDWINFRLSDPKSAEALVFADLIRLNYYRIHVQHPEKDKVWMNTMQALHDKFFKNPVIAEIDILIANYYYAIGSKYSYSDTLSWKNAPYMRKAYDLVDQVVKMYPDTTISAKCMNLKSSIEKKEAGMYSLHNSGSGKNTQVQIYYRNVNKVNLSLLKIDYEDYRKIERKYYDREDKIAELLSKSTIVSTEKIDLGNETDMNMHARNYFVKPLPKGHYLYVLHQSDNIADERMLLSYNAIFITDFIYTHRASESGDLEFFVMDRTSGDPVKGAQITFYTEKYNYITSSYNYDRVKQLFTDTNGYVCFNPDDDDYRSYYADIRKGADFVAVNNYLYSYNYNYNDDDSETVTLFTDRAIYRPGQTIYFKGIATSTKLMVTKLLPKLSTTVELRDPNYQVVGSAQVKTNNFGSFAGSFEIPLGTVTGQFQISCIGGTKYISVEEYKRPNFEVVFKPVEDEYRIGDSIKVTSKVQSYAGSNITDAKVKFTVTRQVSWRGWPYYYSYIPAKEVCFGDVVTDENGDFTVSFRAEPDNEVPGQQNVCFQYSVSATVTDITGETQQGSTYVFATNKSLLLESDLPEMVNKTSIDTLRIYARNINGKDINTQVKVRFVALEDTKNLLQPDLFGKTDRSGYSKEEWYSLNPGVAYSNENDYRTFRELKTVLSYDVKTGENFKILIANDIRKLNPGRYCLKLQAKDKFGGDVEELKYFTVYDPGVTAMPYMAATLFIQENATVLPGEKAILYLGTSFKDVKLSYELEHKGVIAERKWINVSNEIKKIEIPVTEDFRGNFTVHVLFVKNGRQYTSTFIFYVPWTNKELNIKLETFRDKIEPGSKEEWKIRITDNDGKPVSAEMLAGMYDASLDAFTANSWWLNTNPYYYSFRYWGTSCYSLNGSRFLYTFPMSYAKVPNDYVMFNWNGYSHGGYYYSYDMSGGYEYEGDMRNYDRMAVSDSQSGMAGGREKAAKEEAPSAAYGMAEMSLVDADETVTTATRNGPTSGEGKMGQQPKIRANFNETAFFYPQMVSDSNGVIMLTFTAPESLTRWNLMALAHTTDLKIGSLNKQIVTQKELMLMPNAPRFIRENDTLIFSAKISNISEKQITGNTTVRLFDAITMREITNELLLSSPDMQKFDVKAGGNVEVNWKISVPSGLAGVVYRITAESETHSDGEEKYLPVLPNRMLVTESIPLPIRGGQTKKFSFNHMKQSIQSSTLTNYKLTLEFTSNPAWYAVQALPYLAEYPYECAEQTFSRYYANSLAAYIANSDPKIKRVFDVWKSTPGSDALKSNLEKNEELKALLLEETPWVLEAQDETERKHRIALLFDVNQMKNQLSTALSKLKKMQVYNGAWPWFDGMPEDRYITQHIVGGIGHLQKLGVVDVSSNNELYSMAGKAIDYMDNELVKDYKALLKYYTPKEMELNHLGYYQIHYLYVRSFYKDIWPIPEKSKTAFEYYKKQAEKYWLSNNRYMQGMLALALFRFDEKEVASDIVASLKEYSLQSEEMGMYWKSDAGYYWYEAPIETQSLMIEVFNEVSSDSIAVEEMKIWLLKQKQTQDWKTTKATADAIYALLLTGMELLSDDQLVEITLGTEKINPAEMKDLNVEAGTGYFSKFWSGSEIKPEMADITVKKPGKGIGWGAVYWQYFEQLDKITSFKDTPLKIDKKLFVELRKDGKVVMTPVTEKTQLHVGDRVIVRIEIRTDRNMEYVHLKDMRAACFEPESVFSGYRYEHGLGFYQSIRDASMNFFISYLHQGTYVFEYPLIVSQRGEFSNGITTMQCMYAPEFTTHSQGIRVKVQ
ncbi:MAG TPA: alpha-2-macroglobulin family protein [Bacteroidales bacterium]|nr:alpha-2-macroglobulin family protein [Bacteroidales bacterium]